MFAVPMLISVLLLATGNAAFACALYADRGHGRTTDHRLIYGIAFCLMLWGFGLALRVSAASEAAAVIGSRIAPPGYLLLFGLLLHFVLRLTGRGSLLRRKWAVPLLYLPGAVAAFGLVVLPCFGLFPTGLERTPYGWVNNTENIWLWFYYAYYAVYLALTLLLLLRWRRRNTRETIRRQAALFAGSILAMAALGSATDALPGAFGVHFPGIAAVFSILPELAICYSSKRLGFLRAAAPNPDEVILDRLSYANICRVLAICFAAGGALNLVALAAPGGAHAAADTLGFTGLMLAMGFCVLAMNRIRSDEAVKELLLSFTVSLVIPAVTLHYPETGGVTVWVFVFFLLVPGVLFGRRILLCTVFAAAVQSQLVLMGAAGRVAVEMGGSQNAARFGSIAIMAFICFFVSAVYRGRLRENLRHAARQNAMSGLSRTLLAAGAGNWEKVMEKALAQCGRFLQCDRTCLMFAAETEKGKFRFARIWRAGEGGIFVPEDGWETFFDAVTEQLDGKRLLVLPEEGGDLPAEFRHAMGGGRLRSLAAVPVMQGGKPAGFLCCGSARGAAEWAPQAADFLDIAAGLVTDALANLANYYQMQYIAYHDQLTGLPNRLLFKDRLTTAMKLADRAAKLVGVVYFDLDSFKVVNDTMGHELGDLLLSKVARVLGSHVREYDTVSRFGGDEFVLVLDQLAGVRDAERVMEKLMEAIRRPVDLMGQEFFITGSAGVALYPQDGETAEELITNADIAMYRAKGMGKNHWVLCSQDMKDRIIGQVKLRNLLYRALDRKELLVYYQPQVQMGTGKIVGTEALLRWNLPGRGMVSPAEFIPTAEKSGLICPIGAWVLETACRQSVHWRRQGFPPMRMAVNISVQQLRDKRFVDQVAGILEKTGLPPEGLELEVTESVANSGVADVPKIFAGLKALGISLSIDDFGTEYSSLNRLKLLPVDRLKLDIQFVQGIEGSDKDRAVTQVIINLAKSLHMKIVAEGVETPGQLAYLSERRCDEVQGFYYYRPMPAEELEKLLAGGKIPGKPGR